MCWENILFLTDKGQVLNLQFERYGLCHFDTVIYISDACMPTINYMLKSQKLNMTK